MYDDRAVVQRRFERVLAERLRPFALELVESFGLEPEHLRMAVATDAETQRQEEAHAWFTARRAAGEEPEDEKAVRAREKAARGRRG